MFALFPRFTHKNVRSDQKRLSHDLRKGRIPSEQVIGIRGAVHWNGHARRYDEERMAQSRSRRTGQEPVAGKTVTLIKDFSENDRYGRLLRCVFVDRVLVNYELWREGTRRQRRINPTYRVRGLFYEAQLQAQQAHRVCGAPVPLLRAFCVSTSHPHDAKGFGIASLFVRDLYKTCAGRAVSQMKQFCSQCGSRLDTELTCPTCNPLSRYLEAPTFPERVL